MIYEIEDGVLYSALGNDEHVEIPDGVEYITRDTFYNGKMKSVRFPESLRRIGRYAFCKCVELESVRIPDGVERIDAFAFAGCEKLREVILPKSLKRIRANCFYQNNALERINIPESVKRIGPKAFDGCTSLREVALPEGLEEIMDDAFRESGLRAVEIPASTRFIGTAVFNDCNDLETLVLHEGLEEIGDYAFSKCALKRVELPGTLKKLGKSAFKFCRNLEQFCVPDGVFTIRNGILQKYTGAAKHVVVPDGVTGIGIYAFSKCNSISSVHIPSSVTGIGSYAFACCENLTDIHIPDSVTSIGDRAFAYCKNLASVHLPSDLTSIGLETFDYCTALESINLPDGLTSIEDLAFSYCASLEEIHIPSSVTSIGNAAFACCTSLTSIHLPDSVTSIGKGLFNSCSSLTSVSIRNGLSRIDDRMFCKCSSLTSITLPDGISCIEKGAFSDTACYRDAANWSDGVLYIGKYLIEANADLPSGGYVIRPGTKYIADAAFFSRLFLTSIVIPDSVTCIGNEAFCWCRGLTSITISNGVTSIGDRAFADCKSLTSISIPQSVTRIGEGAFANCILLSELLIANPDCKAGQTLFGERYSVEIVAQAKLYHRALMDGDLKKYILNRENWAKLDAATQADIFLAHPGEKLLMAYMDCVTDSEKMGEAILNRLSNETSAKDCNIAASFMSLFAQLISAELFQRMYERLKTIKAASKAVKTIGADAVLMKKLKTAGHTGTPQPMVECKMVDIMNLVKLSGSALGIKLREYYGLSLKDIPELKCRDGQLAPPMVMAYLLTMHEGYSSSDGDRELTVEYKNPGVCPEAADIVAGLEHESLQDCLKKLVKENLGAKVRGKKMFLLYPICRYAGESLMEQLAQKAHSWTSSPRRCFEEAYIYSNTRAAMIFADQFDSLKQYAAVRNATPDIVRDRLLSDIGLDEDGGKSYDLGNRTVVARLQADLGFLVELPSGKTAKSLPKKGADVQKIAVAEADFSEMKKYAGKIVQNRAEALFSDFLSGRARDAEDWRAAYLRNPLLRSVASRVVWRQDNSTFILKDGQPINSSGQTYSIGRKPIMPAHPMEMQPQELSAWQKYLTSHAIEQPFVQMWEPVIAAESVHEDRYKGKTIPYRCFLNQQRHGFTVTDEDFHDQINIYIRGCYAQIKRIDWEYHCIEPDHRFEVEKLHFSRYTRQVNHIVSLLDSWAE